MYHPIVYEHRYYAARIYAQKPRRNMLMFSEVDVVRLPIDIFLIQENAHFLRRWVNLFQKAEQLSDQERS